MRGQGHWKKCKGKDEPVSASTLRNGVSFERRFLEATGRERSEGAQFPSLKAGFTCGTLERNRSLQKLSMDPKNTVIIMSGRTRDTLEKNFAGMRAIGIAAEHGYYYRKPYDSEWEIQQVGWLIFPVVLAQSVYLKRTVFSTELFCWHVSMYQTEKDDKSWLKVVHDIMLAYTQRTDGSYMEEKTAGIVWHYLDADPEFGTWQAKEMHAHLESVLDTSVVEVISGVGWLQVRYKHISKGMMVQRILSDGRFIKAPDFVLCVGDDKTDEDMFSYLSKDTTVISMASLAATVLTVVRG